MSKYIDAEKLIAEIERQIEEDKNNITEDTQSYYGARQQVRSKLLAFISSLQQEQPKPTCKSCGFYENNCPFIRGKFIPYPNKVCKDYTYSVMREQPEFPTTDEEMEKFLATAPNVELPKKYENPDWLFKKQEQPETDMESPFTGGKVAILSREEEVTFRGEKVKILRKYYRCEDTGREFTNDKLDDDMMWAAFRAYCEKKGMTSFTDIARHFYGLGLNARKEDIVI